MKRRIGLLVGFAVAAIAISAALAASGPPYIDPVYLTTDFKQGIIVRVALQSDVYQYLDGGPFTGGGSSTSSAPQFLATGVYTGGARDGGGNFLCNQNPAVSSPCLANFANPLEIGGFTSDPSSSNSAVYIGAMEQKLAGPILEVLNNYGQGIGGEFHALDSMYNGDLQIAGDLILGTAGTDIRIRNPNGALYLQMGGSQYVWNTSGAGADVTQWFNSATTTVASVQNDGALCSASTKTRGTSALVAGGKTLTVVSGATCVCGKVTNASNGITCSVSGTTLTAAGTGTDQFSYVCIGAP